MSVASQIERLQNIKTAIRSALISKGVPAESHNVENFADDIRSIEAGITPTGKYTYPVGSLGGDTDITNYATVNAENVYTKGNADGQEAALESLPRLEPTALGTNIRDGYNYKAVGNGYAIAHVAGLTPNDNPAIVEKDIIYRAFAAGYAIDSYSNIAPSEDGTRFESGFNRMSSGGYAYSEKPPSGGNKIIVHRVGTNTVTTLSDVPIDATIVGVNWYETALRFGQAVASVTYGNAVTFYWRTGSSPTSNRITIENSAAISISNPLNIKTVNGKKVWQMYTYLDADYEVFWM